MATTPDFPILGSPRISAAGFAAVLRGASSPAAGEAGACYQAFTDVGVDPAVGLAVFRKESTYGKFGRANRNRSWGNIRGGTSYPLDGGRFRIYPSWTAGAADAARLLTIYGTNRIRPGTRTDTVQRFPYVWAPSSDGNAPDAYGDSLARWISEWSTKYPAAGSGPPIIGASNAILASATISEWQAQLARFGIPNDPDHVFTHDEAVKIVDALWPAVSGHRIPDHDNSVAYFEGKTVRDTAAGGNTSIGPSIPSPLDGVADAIGGIPAALGDALTHVAVLMGILGLIAMGIWLVATSDR